MSKDSKTAKLRNELLSSVEEWASEAAEDFGLSKDKAAQLGTYIADQLAEQFGGSMLSFPKDRPYFIHLRDREMYAEYTGNNHHALARKYKLGVRAVYNIMKKVEAAYISDRQPELF